jgi:ABC-type uncharacterized transport system substrate-binding protein
VKRVARLKPLPQHVACRTFRRGGIDLRPFRRQLCTSLETPVGKSACHLFHIRFGPKVLEQASANHLADFRLPLARAVDLAVATFNIRRTEDIAPAFEALTGQVDALYVSTDMLMLTNRVRINTLALGSKLPTMHGARQYVEAGGLMSYGTNYTAQFRRAADYVDKVLRGTKPSDIPVEQPTKFDLVINLTTAKALGLTIPESFLLRADEVID